MEWLFCLSLRYVLIIKKSVQRGIALTSSYSGHAESAKSACPILFYWSRSFLFICCVIGKILIVYDTQSMVVLGTEKIYTCHWNGCGCWCIEHMRKQTDTFETVLYIATSKYICYTRTENYLLSYSCMLFRIDFGHDEIRQLKLWTDKMRALQYMEYIGPSLTM